MLIGAVAGFSIGVSTGNPWLGLLVAMLAGGLLSLLHGVMTIHLRADQVVSGLALTFLGTGLARVLGEGLSSAGDVATLPRLTIPVLSSRSRSSGRSSSRDQSVARLRRLPARAGRLVLDQPDAAGAAPAGGRRGPRRRRRAGHRGLRDPLRAMCSSAGCWPVSPGATITLAISPGWFGDQTVNGRGWIAVGLVIFAQWSPLRAAFGALLFGAIFRFILDIQGVHDDLRRRQPVHGRPLRDVLPRDAAVPDGHPRRRHRVARGGRGSGSGRRRRSACRTSGASAAPDAGSVALVAGRHSSVRTSRPSSSIWT